jgi:hypothetical protein
VPKCEIFDRLDSHDFYTITSLREGDLGIKIKKILKIFRSSFGAVKFLTRMLSLILRSAVPSKHAEHTHKGLMRTLSIRVRNWCVRWAYASGTDAHAEQTHQFLTRMISISVKIPNLKRAFKPCWAYASGTDACTEHAREGLMRMLSVRISSLRVCSACAPEIKWGLAPPKIRIIS